MTQKEYEAIVAEFDKLELRIYMYNGLMTAITGLDSIINKISEQTSRQENKKRCAPPSVTIEKTTIDLKPEESNDFIALLVKLRESRQKELEAL